jgi:hypothetical protein
MFRPKVQTGRSFTRRLEENFRCNLWKTKYNPYPMTRMKQLLVPGCLQGPRNGCADAAAEARV